MNQEDKLTIEQALKHAYEMLADPNLDFVEVLVRLDKYWVCEHHNIPLEKFHQHQWIKELMYLPNIEDFKAQVEKDSISSIWVNYHNYNGKSVCKLLYQSN